VYDEIEVGQEFGLGDPLLDPHVGWRVAEVGGVDRRARTTRTRESTVDSPTMAARSTSGAPKAVPRVK
jgi:hypothetical protein